jgi:hypothetical protein
MTRASSPTPQEALTEIAHANRRRREYQAQEKAWRQVEALLTRDVYVHNLYTKLKLAFDQGWIAATTYHTATPGRKGLAPDHAP